MKVFLKGRYFLRVAFLLSLLSFIFVDLSWAAPMDGNKQFNSQHKKRIKILAIDGGGVRGIIPALVLKDLEIRLRGKKLVECFDVMAGTSTGGLIVLFLNAADHKGKPLYNIDEIIPLYINMAQEIFQDSPWHKITTLFGWVDAKYSAKPLEEILEQYFGETELKDTLTNVLVPAYEIEQDKNFFFRTSKAKSDPGRNYKLKDLARAITAAPTYFRPAIIEEITGQHTYTLIDGGISVNNPTLSATVHAVELYGTKNDFLIVSIGTGTNFGADKRRIPREDVETSGLIGWAEKIVPLMMYAVNEVTDYQMRYVFDNTDHRKDYYRLQVTLEPENSDLDDVSPENIEVLKNKADELIKENDAALELIAKALVE